MYKLAVSKLRYCLLLLLWQGVHRAQLKPGLQALLALQRSSWTICEDKLELWHHF